MWPRGLAKLHPAAGLLDVLSSEGCPCDLGENWTKKHILEAINRGNHISATQQEESKCMEQEAKEKVAAGYAKIIQWKDIMNNIPPNLKISPAAMIPHKSRLFRMILDLTFRLRKNGKNFPSVNSNTKKLAPQKSMTQLGSTVKRIIHIMNRNYNLSYAFMFSKCDLKDSFWKMVLNMMHAWNFFYLLQHKTSTPVEERRLVVPNALQMGWSESPLLFYTATETADGVSVIDHLYGRKYHVESVVIWC